MFQTNTNNNGGNGNKSSSIKRHHNQHPYQNYNNRSSSSSSSFTQSHHRHQQQQQNGGGPERVIRSEVWNCFDLDGLNAICRACNERLKVGPTRQTSSLWRHLKRHTREVQSQLLRPSRSTPSAVKYLPNRDGHGQQQQQQFGEFMTSAESNTLRNLGPGPLVTVDCKPVESLDLEQLLLGIQQQSDDGQSPMEELLDGEIMINGKGTTMMDTDTILLEENDKEEEDNNHINGDGFQKAVIEFLLENALPFRRTIFQSPSLTRLLQSFSSANAIGDPQRRHPTMLLPSPDSLLGCFAPKMFNRDLEERKAQFEDDFFVLVLRRMRVDIGQPKGTWITRVSAVKLSQSFGLCSRSLGVFAFRGGINRMRDALQKCFEHGNIQLKLWQVSAVMHDGTADFVELCKQLDLPGIPSTRSLLRNIYVELDKLEFSAECLRRVKTRFEQAIGDTLDDSHFSAFSISVPFLINRIDHFFQENCTEERSSEQPSADVRLMQKFRTLWAFQRERLLAEPVARMSIFLNPNACHQLQGPFNVEQWAQIGANIVEEICQACLPAADEISEVEIQERKADIEAEVNNFIESAICEGRSRIGDQQGGMAREEVTVKKQSLSELLFLERFPRVGHLARQFCAIPLWETDSGDWRTGKKQGSNEHQLSNLHDIDTKNATYAAELMRKDLADQGEEEALQTLTQLLTIRMAILERNGCVLLE